MFKLIHYRNRCIGCNACVEISYQRWRMSKKDGKAVLLGSKDKKGFWAVAILEQDVEVNQKAAQACPVNIIQVR